MIARFGLICATAVVILGGVTGTADAQIVSITSGGYVAGPPPKADPQGGWTVPAGGGEWRVIFDYGTAPSGTFTLDLTIGIGGTVPIFPPKVGGTGTWGPLGQETLKNPLPASTNVRARLQKKNAGGVWVDQGNPAYYPLN